LVLEAAEAERDVTTTLDRRRYLVLVRAERQAQSSGEGTPTQMCVPLVRSKPK